MKRLLLAIVILALLAAIALVVIRIAGESPAAIRARADESFEQGEYEAALLSYRKLLAKDENDPHALRQAGMIWMARGAPLRALPFLRKAREADSGDLEVRQKWAELLLAIGDLGGVREEALEILTRDSANHDAILLLANTSFNAEQIGQTRQHLEAFDPERDAAWHLAEAILLGREAKTDAVEPSLQRSLAVDPDSVAVHLAFASYYATRNEPASQLESLAQASRLAEPRSSAHVRYALALAGDGQIDAARKLLNDLLRKVGDYLPAHQAFAELQVREGAHDKALATLETVFRLDPVNLDARATEAKIYLAKGEPAKAVESYEKLTTAYPAAPRLKYDLATYYLRNDEPDRARSTLEALLQSAPELSREHADAVLLLAEIDLRDGKPAAASARLETLRETRPELPRPPFLLARAYQEEGRHDEAARVFLEEIEKNPRNPALHFALARVYKSQDRFEEASRSFQQAQDLAPDDQTITIELIALDLRNKDFAAAHARVQPSLDKPDPDWGALYLRGRILTAEERWEEAEQVLQQALDLKPGSLSVYNLLVEIYLQTGQTDAAIARLTTLAAENPEVTQHRMLLSLLLEREGDYQRAADNYRALVKDNPDFVPALNNLAYLLGSKLRDFPEAEKLARSARRMAGEDAAIADTLGWILTQQEDEAKVQEGLKLLMEAAGRLENPEIRYHLAVALAKTGSREEARKTLERALRAEGEFPWKDEATQFLASLGGQTPASAGESIPELEARRQSNPLDLPVRIRLGERYEAAGEPQSALEVYREALKLDSTQPDVLKALARLMEADDPVQARTFARQAWQLAPSDPEARALEAHWLLAEKAHPQAYQLLSPIVESTTNPAHLRDFASAAYSIGKIAEARAAMKRVPADSPLAAEAATFLALTAEPGQDDLPALEAQAESALESDPQNIPALMVRAARLARAGQSAPAIEAYENVRVQRPVFTPALLELAALYADQPETLAKAESLALGILERGGSTPQLDRLLGEILARQGKFQAAIAPLEKCDQASQLDAEGLFFLGKAYHNADRPADAKATLQRAQQAGLESDLADEAAKLLSEIETN